MKNIKISQIQRNWHLIDAKSKILGRLASATARILMGKNKSYFTPHLDTGDYVVVINAKDIILTGKKEKQKKYYRHPQYPGGLKERSASQIRAQKSEDLIRHAVSGMLPKTSLGKQMLKKLYIFDGVDHPYKDKFSTKSDTPSPAPIAFIGK